MSCIVCKGIEMKIGIVIKKAIIICLIVGMSLTSVTGCGSHTKIVFTTGLSGNQIFKIGSSACTKAEIMIYLTTFYHQFAGAYGAEMWNYDFGGTSLEDHVKDIVMSKMVQIKMMNLMAADQKISLSEEEEKKVAKASEKYEKQLSEKLKQKEDITTDVILKVYREYLLANKVYQIITQSAEMEISDDEARTVVAQVIYFKNWKIKNKEKILMSEEEVQNVQKTARKVLSRIRAGEDFETLAIQHSDNNQVKHSFARGNVEPSFEELLFSLNTGEISDLIELDDGYYIVKCVSTMDYEATQQNKLVLAEKRKEEAFEKAYEEMSAGVPVQFRARQWKKLTLNEAVHDTDADFFEIYEEFMKQ